MKLAPEDAQAWITRAVVLTVRGRYEEARQHCAQLVPLASNLVVAVCQTGIESVELDPEDGYVRAAYCDLLLDREHDGAACRWDQAAAGGARGRRSAASILATVAGSVTAARTVSLPPQ